MSSEIDYLLKILILGDSSVGKTSILLKFCDDKFNPNHMPTIGIDFKAKILEMSGKKVKIQLWDTAGQERFKTITTTLYNGVLGICLVFAIDNRQSFQNVENWMKQIKDNVKQDMDVAIILIGNKCDVKERKVEQAEGQYLAKSYNIPYFETSAKVGTNINDCFIQMTQQIMTNIQKKPSLYKKPEQSGGKVLSVQQSVSEKKNDKQDCQC